MAEETAGRQVLRAGFLELCLPDSSILPLWVQLDALSPVQDLRPSWSEGLLSLFSDSKLSVRVAAYVLDEARVAPSDDTLIVQTAGVTLVLRCAVGPKVIRKWAVMMRKVCASTELSTVPTISLKDEKDLSAVEAHLQRTIEECGLLRGLLDLSDASRKRCTGLLSSSETRVEEARVALMKLKKEQGMSTPQQVMRTASSGASLSSSTQRLLGRSVADLVVQLREKGAPPELVAKHIYYAMGHRPIADDRANAVMSPATVDMVDALPKVSTTSQMEQLVSIISKDDPFALSVVKEYAVTFLRLRGLDVDLGLHRLLYHFKLPKESQQIARVIRAFSETFHSLHVALKPYDPKAQAFRPASPEPGISYGPGDYIDWPDAESVELIVFAMVMLNGDLHNPENAEKMTREQFIQNIQRSGAKVVLTEDALKDMYYGRIRDDPIVFDNSQQLFVDAVRKSFVEVKVNATPGLRMWTKCWGVLTENYDVTTAPANGERRSGGLGILYVCKSPTENVVYLTFPLRRTVGLVEISKKEFCLVQSSGLGTTASSSSLRGVLGGASGSVKQEETRVKYGIVDVQCVSAFAHVCCRFRCKTEREATLWLRAFHYLLTGGYGFWYPSEVRDTETLDLPGTGADDSLDATPGTESDARPRRRRRRKPKVAATLEAEAAAAAAVQAAEAAPNSPRNEINLDSEDL